MGKANTGVQSASTSELTKLLTPDDVAELFQIDKQLLNKWRSARRGPQFVKIGHAVRYRAEDVKVWVDGQTMKTELKLV